MRPSQNIIKLEGYGVYVTLVDDKIFISEIDLKNEGPTLDPDHCIQWDEVEEVPNQKFLNLVNANFGTAFTVRDFGGAMTISEIKEFTQLQKERKEKDEHES